MLEWMKQTREKSDDVTNIVPKEDAEKLTIKDLTSENAVVKDLTLDQIFQILKASVKSTNLEALAHMVECCISIKDNLETTGQTDLLYTMKQRMQTIGEEYNAIQNGFMHYLYMKDIITIIRKVNDDRGFKYLTLDDIKNYHRLIPTESLPIVKVAKETFNELLVLHCDPKGVHQMQKTQTTKDRDPILFGRVTPTSEKLYLIASWADNLCDYTLEELLDDMSAHMTGEDYTLKIDNLPETINEVIDQLNATCGIWHKNYVTYNELPGTYFTSSTTTASNNLIIFNTTSSNIDIK